MDWIHCNICFVQPLRKKPQFILTSCGHMFCEMCINRETPNLCKICKAKCGTTKLGSNLIPKVKEYFEEPLHLLERALKACNFQKGHGLNLAKGNFKMRDKYTKSKYYYHKLEAESRKLESYNKKLDKIVSEYERRQVCSNDDRFYFMPNTNETESPFFKTQYRKTSHPSRKPTVLVKQKPDAFRSYRYQTQQTPMTESSTKSSPNSNDFRFSRNSQPPSCQNISFVTPSYGVQKNFQITNRGHR